MAKIWGDNNESKGLIQGKDLKSIIYKKDFMTRDEREDDFKNENFKLMKQCSWVKLII
jgi:hypothetical protein